MNRIRPALAVAVAVVAVAVIVTVAVHALNGAGSPAASEPKAHAFICVSPSPNQLTKSARAGADSRLVPGEPVGALVCRYPGTGAPMASQHVLSGPQAVRLAAALDAGRAVTGSVLHCPMDTGQADIVVFAFASGPDLTVRVALSGCRLASNGSVARSADAAADQLLG
jgi:hypothetical protein